METLVSGDAETANIYKTTLPLASLADVTK
jgi:hypothetical protein